MSSSLKRLALASLCLSTLATPARASDSETFNFDYYCVTGSFQVCASVRLQSVNNNLKLQVWNLQGVIGSRHTITAIGLYHLGPAWDGTVLDYSVNYVTQTGPQDITSFWTEQGGNDIRNLEGIRAELREGTEGNAGIIGCSDPGGQQKWATCMSFPDKPYVEFSFNLTSHFSLEELALRWHSQQLLDGSSVKCDTGGDQDSDSDSDDSDSDSDDGRVQRFDGEIRDDEDSDSDSDGNGDDCAPNDPPTIVPEPTTLIMLGSGLLGIFGAVQSRRRNKRSLSE